eukprot:750187-Hanusia_phi.AAC.2
MGEMRRREDQVRTRCDEDDVVEEEEEEDDARTDEERECAGDVARNRRLKSREEDMLIWGFGRQVLTGS